MAGVCDTLFVPAPGGGLFAKNSDRPPGEVQLVAAHGRRSPGGPLATQYLTLSDAGAAATLLARPAWLWGAEHGINEHGLAAGNERVATVDDAGAAPAALLGMDLVRLALERARGAAEAVDVVTGLLETYGQGGVGMAAYDEAYFSSFLFADPAEAWVLETSGRTWAARPAPGAAAISNRLSLGRDWIRASAGVARGTDVQGWRDPAEPTGYADRRLAAAEHFLAGPDPGRPEAVVAHLRDHGTGPWGAPGSGGPSVPPPAGVEADFTGVTVCMHVRGYMATTSSMVAELVAGPGRPRLTWVAPGSPCVSVYLPVFPPQPALPTGAVPGAVGDPSVWDDGAALARAVEADGSLLAGIRAVLDPLEAELWEEARAVSAASPAAWPAAAVRWSDRVGPALRRLRAALAPEGAGRAGLPSAPRSSGEG